MRQIVAACAAFVFVFLLAFTGYAGDLVKPFTFKTLEGKVLDSRALKSTPLVINIGSHWWPDCKREAPELQKAYLSYKEKGVRFIGVFAMSKDEDIKKFAETYKITFPVGRENGIAESLDIRGIPATVFIAKDGRLIKKHMGVIAYAELVSGIEAILR